MSAGADGKCNSTMRCMKCDAQVCMVCQPGVVTIEVDLTAETWARVMLCKPCLLGFARNVFETWKARGASNAQVSGSIPPPRMTQ